ncbi:MAG: hypothetical protein LBC14_02250 [Desulfovibrio sp.]|nr:hypothetical protein [Desulfovibrio sp.]
MLRKHALLKFRGVVVRCTAYAVILTLCLPPAAAFAPAPARAWASHAAYVLQRMSSAERQAEVAVSARDTSWGYPNPNSNAQGAAGAAGWPNVTYYWTGEAVSAYDAVGMYLYDGGGSGVSGHGSVACRR